MKKIIKSKFLLILFFGILISGFSLQESKACDIEISVIKGKRDTYQVGDTIDLLVYVKLTHRSCPVKMKETKFKMKGLKVIKSTSWKQESAMEWKRKLKVVIKETKNGKLNLTAVRECEKDGGFGSIKLNAVSP